MTKQRIDVAFVILHYLVDKQTIKCIDYIQKNIDTDKYKIILVDNASENGSFESVKAHYGTRDDRIVFIQNKNNLGYAKANNVGINYVMRKYFFDFVCCLNNDVYIIEKELYSKLKYFHKKNGFAVLGPLILDGAGQYTSNPQVSGLINSRIDLEKKIARYKMILNIYKLRMHKIFHLLKWIRNRKNKIRKSIAIPEYQENVQLSGACLFFSNTYFSSYKGFYPKTFLYKEEDILRYQLMKKHLLSVFLPDIVVYHEEDAATDQLHSKNIKKEIFVYNEYINSLNSLKELMNEDNFQGEYFE